MLVQDSTLQCIPLVRNIITPSLATPFKENPASQKTDNPRSVIGPRFIIIYLPLIEIAGRCLAIDCLLLSLSPRSLVNHDLLSLALVHLTLSLHFLDGISLTVLGRICDSHSVESIAHAACIFEFFAGHSSVKVVERSLDERSSVKVVERSSAKVVERSFVECSSAKVVERSFVECSSAKVVERSFVECSSAKVVERSFDEVDERSPEDYLDERSSEGCAVGRTSEVDCIAEVERRAEETLVSDFSLSLPDLVLFQVLSYCQQDHDSLSVLDTSSKIFWLQSCSRRSICYISSLVD